MKLNYNDVINLIKSLSRFGADWDCDKEQLILVGEYNTYTYCRNRTDNLNLTKSDYKKAVIIKPTEDKDLFEIIYPTDEEVRAF